MSEFLINTPYHKRWWLPCHCHQYNTVLHGTTVHCSIIEPLRHETVASWNIEIKLGWENLSSLSQELANKNHPPRLGKLARCKIVRHG